MKTRIIYAAVAVLIATLGWIAVGHGQRSADIVAHERARARTLARSVAWVYAQERLSGDSAGQTQRYAQALMQAEPTLKGAFVLDDMTFRVHSVPGKVDGSLDRASLDDKELYDQGKSLKAAHRKNLLEREDNPAATRSAYQEIAEMPLEGGLWLAVSAPVIVNGEYEAMAQAQVELTRPELPLPTGVLLWSLGALILLVGLARLPGRRAHVAAGAAVLLAMVWGQSWTVGGWHAELRWARAVHDSVSWSAMAEAGLVAAGQNEPSSLASDVSRDAFGVPVGGVVAVLKNDQAAPPDTELFRPEGSAYTVHFAKSWFEQAGDSDRGHLTKWWMLLGLLALIVFVLGSLGLINRAGVAMYENRVAYAYVSPAMIGMVLLVFIPVAFGVTLGFMQRRYNVFEFAGLANYIEILGDFDIGHPQNFYFKLGVTILWTLLNVGLHLGIGLFFALLLNDSMLKAKGLFRVILILPWAIPNYITALIWKGMFHKQFGAVNFFLESLGIEPIAWFQGFWSAFATNVITNTWLGFPFMLVVSLGAMQSIPSDLYEAAEVDGSSRWQRFRHITLPLLMPALVPAVIVGTIWTFNMFNIIYLVSGGAPNGSTDILITDAFRWAFERDRYGYAAAYSTVIFVILLAFSMATNKLTGATEGALD